METIPGWAGAIHPVTKSGYDRILRLPEVVRRVGLSRSSIYAMVSDGRFPRQFALGGRSVGWMESDVNAWVLERTQGVVRI